MKVLMVHARYRTPGGEDVSVAAEAALLRAAGVEVETLLLGPLGPGAAASLLWNGAAGRAVAQRLAAVPFDLVHVQNVFPAGSAAVLRAAVDSGRPVVHTLRNYRLLCPAGTLWRPGGGVCAAPACLRLGCWQGSRVATAAARLAVALQGWSGALAGVARFITPSAALRDALAGVVPPGRVSVVPNALAADPGVGRGPRAGIVYAGRLVEEKGVADLLAVARRLGPEHAMQIIGDGPLAERLSGAPPWVIRLPSRSHAEVLSALREAAVVAVPSRWAEPFGRVALEAMACGTAVVASRVGGLPEVVGDAGLLVPPGNRPALAHALEDAHARAAELGHRGRRRYEALAAGAAGHLIAIYEEVLRHPAGRHFRRNPSEKAQSTDC